MPSQLSPADVVAGFPADIESPRMTRCSEMTPVYFIPIERRY